MKTRRTKSKRTPDAPQPFAPGYAGPEKPPNNGAEWHENVVIPKSGEPRLEHEPHPKNDPPSISGYSHRPQTPAHIPRPENTEPLTPEVDKELRRHGKQKLSGEIEKYNATKLSRTPDPYPPDDPELVEARKQRKRDENAHAYKCLSRCEWLKQLLPKDNVRDEFLRHQFYKVSLQELADQADESKVTIQKRLERAKAKIQAYLESAANGGSPLDALFEATHGDADPEAMKEAALSTPDVEDTEDVYGFDLDLTDMTETDRLGEVLDEGLSVRSARKN